MADEPHRHGWKPIPSWYGRYRCSECFVIGYRGSTQPKEVYGDKYQAETIFPYICKKCDKGAVITRPVQLCAEHKRSR
jgi:hypothetical protein